MAEWDEFLQKQLDDPDVRAEWDALKAEFLVATLPPYLQSDILALEDGIKNSSTLLDCLLNEVQGSINAAFYDNAITESEAKYLREKYLGIGGLAYEN